jgi:hypothetical protein
LRQHHRVLPRAVSLSRNSRAEGRRAWSPTARVQALYLPAVAPGARALAEHLEIAGKAPRGRPRPLVTCVQSLCREGDLCERASHDPVLSSKKIQPLAQERLEMFSATKNHYTGAGKERGRSSGLRRKPAQRRQRSGVVKSQAHLGELVLWVVRALPCGERVPIHTTYDELFRPTCRLCCLATRLSSSPYCVLSACIQAPAACCRRVRCAAVPETGKAPELPVLAAMAVRLRHGVCSAL